MKTPAETEDTASDDLGPQDLVFGEGMLVDDDGTLVKTYVVHLGQAADVQWPNEMPVVVKGSAQRNAIERRRTIRLSKPEVFRNEGETLLSDLDEGVTRHEESSETVRVDDPTDLSRAAEVDDEMNRGAAAIGSKRRGTVKSTKTTNRNSTKTTHTYGKNGWIWCAAVEPKNDQQRDVWLQSLGDDYDCVTTINSPRAFARQLAMMAAHQIGPRGSIVTYTHPFAKHETKHSSMSVFHGAVAYVDDPHAYVSGADNDFERMLRAVFFKHTRYAHQREYRFVVWSEAEPEEATVDLQATPELLAQVHTTPIGHEAASASTPAAQPTEHSRPAAQTQRADETESAPNEEPAERASSRRAEASDREGSPSQPVHVVVSPNDMLQDTERVDKRSTRTAQIRRMTVRNAQNLSEAEIDAANAEVETRPDDARITKLVVDGGPGGTAQMHGVRQGLTGTYRQRTRRDQLTIRVETMNPNATVQIDPPNSAPNQEGHVVTVPDGEDTVITITATSPDGTARSEIKYIALRTDEGEQEAA